VNDSLCSFGISLMRMHRKGQYIEPPSPKWQKKNAHLITPKNVPSMQPPRNTHMPTRNIPRVRTCQLGTAGYAGTHVCYPTIPNKRPRLVPGASV
jgi:hypothetical protein